MTTVSCYTTTYNTVVLIDFCQNEPNWYRLVCVGTNENYRNHQWQYRSRVVTRAILYIKTRRTCGLVKDQPHVTVINLSTFPRHLSSTLTVLRTELIVSEHRSTTKSRRPSHSPLVLRILTISYVTNITHAATRKSRPATIQNRTFCLAALNHPEQIAQFWHLVLVYPRLQSSKLIQHTNGIPSWAEILREALLPK